MLRVQSDGVDLAARLLPGVDLGLDLVKRDRSVHVAHYAAAASQLAHHCECPNLALSLIFYFDSSFWVA